MRKHNSHMQALSLVAYRLHRATIPMCNAQTLPKSCTASQCLTHIDGLRTRAHKQQDNVRNVP